MPRAKAANKDVLGLFAFASAVVNLVQADDRKKVQTLYQNLLTRYRDVCNEYQLLARLNQQFRQEILDLRSQNDKLQKEVASARPSK